MFKVEIDREWCIECGKCVDACPSDILRKGKNDAPIVDKPYDCLGCPHCTEACPTNVIQPEPTEDEHELRGGIWTRRDLSDIWQKASTGDYDVRGCGTMHQLPVFDDLVILPAQTSRPPIDAYREPCDTSVTLGDRYAENPLELDIPIMIPAMSFGSCSIEAKVSMARGASMAGTATNTGEGGMHPRERENADTLIAQYASGRFGVSAEYLNDCEAIEIKIGQGAKAGMGGHLMGEKVTEEIAEVRGIPAGSDALSPSRHMDIVGPEDLAMKIEQLREISDWQVPIMVKYSAGRVASDVKIAAKAGADVVVVDGMQGGTGAGPSSVIDHAGLPTLAAVKEADDALKEIGLREEVDLVVSGGIRNGPDVAKALALGADTVAIGTGVLVAMDCNLCQQCNTGRCPVGITTQDPELRKELDPDWGGKAIANYLEATTKEVRTLTQLAGKTAVASLEREDLRALDKEAAEIAEVPLIGRG